MITEFPPLSVHDTESLVQVMKNQEAVDLVKPIKDPKAAAKRLTSEALARKSKDDISCIVIRFGWCQWECTSAAPSPACFVHVIPLKWSADGVCPFEAYVL